MTSNMPKNDQEDNDENIRTRLSCLKAIDAAKMFITSIIDAIINKS